MAQRTGYFRSTRHPWPCQMFLLPLLGTYEAGVYVVGSASTGALRNGADAWLRWVLDVYGMNAFIAAPLLVAGIFVIWSLRRWDDRPDKTFPVVCGMCFESVVLAFGLWAIGHNFDQILRATGVVLATADITVPTDALGQIITYVGAGIYEEAIFRLFAITGLAALLKCASVPAIPATLLAGVASALLFAAAHHIGPHGEPMDTFRFLYRTTAGLYFALIFWSRGFGIAVGSHALYDVLVGVKMG